MTRIRFVFAALLAGVSAPAGAVSPAPTEAGNGMVVTSQHLASEVGVEILKAGGNAVDAAVAVGYALAVVHPCCGNIGGGGFATLHLADGKDTFINFREKAPARRQPRRCISTPRATWCPISASAATRPSACPAPCSASTPCWRATAP